MNILILELLVLTFFSCGHTSSQRDDNQQILNARIDTCDDPDANISCCFINMPTTVTSTMTITNQKEAGEKLIIPGTTYKADGKAHYPNIILYAYHTDSKGYYSKNGTETGIQKWHGRLHGWLKTDSKGYYEIRSIRPARYPGNRIMAHIHAAIKPVDGQPFYINDYVFKDDSLVNEQYLSRLTHIGGTGVVDLKKEGNIWRGKRDIILEN